MHRTYLGHRRDPVCRALMLGASGFLVAASAALAAGAYDPAASQSRYQAERGECLGGPGQQDRATCLREAAAAREEARRGQLDNGAADYQRNALARCQPLPADQRADCVDRMQGRGTASGSVQDGGIYREKVTREIGVPPAATLPRATTLPPAPTPSSTTVPPAGDVPPGATMPPGQTAPTAPLPARPPAY